MKFKKEMSYYFVECEELARKILYKELRKDDAEKIVNFYNSNCSQ